MIDCPNGEIRDRLPDYVHEQLGRAARDEVSAHVGGCAACAAEVALLRELRETLSAAPAVDVRRIVAALPAPGRTAHPVHLVERRAWRQLNWRAAAAVVVLALGGGSAVVWSRMQGDRGVTGTAGVEQPGVRGTGATGAEVQRIAAADLTIDADLGEATAVELEALLDELESFDGLPAGEPEPILASPGGGGLEE